MRTKTLRVRNTTLSDEEIVSSLSKAFGDNYDDKSNTYEDQNI